MWRVIVWGLVIYFVAYAIGTPFERMSGVGEAFVYESYCIGSKTNGIYQCTKEGGRVIVSKRRFKVDFGNQRVIEAGSLHPLYSFIKDCRVFDSENWYCLSQDETYYTTMTDGSFSDSGYFDSKAKVVMRQQTVAIFYWCYYFKGFFGYG